MAQGDTPITLVGNIVADPELRFTPSGHAVATFRVASTPRKFNTNTNAWDDGDPLFLTCNVWRQAAENVAESLRKGNRVILTGNLRQRMYTTPTGDNRHVYEIEVDEVGPSLKFAHAHITRNTPNNQPGAPGQASPAGGGDPWESGQPAAGAGVTDEEPPF